MRLDQDGKIGAITRVVNEEDDEDEAPVVE
jgi:hypothetical protein